MADSESAQPRAAGWLCPRRLQPGGGGALSCPWGRGGWPVGLGRLQKIPAYPDVGLAPCCAWPFHSLFGALPCPAFTLPSHHVAPQPGTALILVAGGAPWPPPTNSLASFQAGTGRSLGTGHCRHRHDLVPPPSAASRSKPLSWLTVGLDHGPVHKEIGCQQRAQATPSKAQQPTAMASMNSPARSHAAGFEFYQPPHRASI